MNYHFPHGVGRLPSKGPYAEMTAAGTTQGTAAEFTADKIMVTTVTSSADGVLLPPGNLDDTVWVVNGDSGDNLKIYPRSGGKINNATADLPLELPPNTAAVFVGINNLNWVAFY